MWCIYSAIFRYYQLERSGGRPAELLLVNSVVGGAEPQEGGGLLGPGPTGGPKVHCTNAPMKRRGAQRGQWPRNNGFASFCFVLITCHIVQSHQLLFVKVGVVCDLASFHEARKEPHITTEAYKNTS